MKNKVFEFHISNCGSTVITIQAKDEDAAMEVFESGEWRSPDPYWESFEIDEIVEVKDESRRFADHPEWATIKS